MTKDLLEVVKTTQYSVEAFVFIQHGLDYTVRDIHGEIDEESETMHSRHISGEQLCQGLRRYAIRQYGLMARTVLSNWKINTCEDFGRIVFAMVDSGLMYKTENDSIVDFQEVFDFDQAFAPQLSLRENR